MGEMSELDLSIRFNIEKYDTAYQLCGFYTLLFDKNWMTPEYERLILDKLRDFATDSTKTEYFW